MRDVMSKRQKKASSDLGENDDVVSLPPSNARRDDSQIRQRAYEIFLERGDAPGDAVSDWLSAAAEFRRAPERPQLISKNREPSEDESST
jgi:hypothetical protein